MDYALKNSGVDETWVLEQCEKYGRPVPIGIQEKPTLRPGLQMVYRAFWDLSTCRSMGMSPGPIPWTATRMWCNENMLFGQQRADVFYLVGAMDMRYLANQRGKISGS